MTRRLLLLGFVEIELTCNMCYNECFSTTILKQQMQSMHYSAEPRETKRDKQRKFKDYDAYDEYKDKKKKKDYSQARRNKRGEE